MKKLIIIGAGGAGVEALWVAQRMLATGKANFSGILGFADDNPGLKGNRLEGLPILGPVAQVLREVGQGNMSFHCAIGSNKQREKVAEALEAQQWQPVALIDPSVIIAETAQVMVGSYIGPLSIVAPHARVGRHVLINTHVGVGHHAVIGDFVQLCPGVRVSGGCKVDKGAFLGSNAVVHPGQTIGEGASIGANSFVIRSVKPRFSMLGVPARIMSRPAENGPDAQG